MKRVTALGATLALLLAPVLVRLLKAQSPPQGSAASFTVSPPALAYVGSVFNFSVTAFDPSKNAAKSYAGTVHFTSTDPQAVLPPDYTFTTTDSGTHMFSATLNAPGKQTITATDTANSAITGTSNSITVSATPPPPPPTFTLTDLGPLQITAAPAGATAFNASGQVTGFRFENFPSPVCFAGGANRAFLWNNGAYTELGTLGGAASFGYGINASGEIAGEADICVNGASSQQRPFIWQNGVMTALDPSTNSNDYSSAFAINTNGDVAGYINHANTGVGYQPVIWKGGTAAGLTLLAPLPCPFGGCQGEALAINDSGQAAGWSYGAQVGGYLHAAMWDSNGQPIDLLSLGRNYNDRANAINSKGDVAGYSQLDPNVYYSIVRAVFWQNGNPQNPQDLGTIPGIDPLFGSTANVTDNSSSAWGINSKGYVVGISALGTNAVTTGNGGRAFLYIPTPAPGTGGQMYDLLSLLAPGTNWRQLQAAWAINDNNQILGVGIDPNQQERGFLLTPIITPTTTALTTSGTPSVFGQPVSLTATVTPNTPSSNTPTGTVTFSDGATVLGAVPPLNNGVAIFNTSALGVGTHAITASYAGDNNFGSSTSSAVNQAVNQAATSTTLMASPNPANLGQAVMFTATVNVVAPGAGSPTGTVAFLDGTTTLGTGAVNSAKTATFSTSSLVAGSHTLTATYNGDTNFTGSTTVSSVTITVQGPPPPVQIVDNETITVTDAESFPDVFDGEAVHVADAVFVTPLIQVSAPVAEFSVGTLGFSGQSGSQTVTVSDIGTASLTVASATISGSSQFTITQIACSNNATSFSTMLPSGGACLVTIGYTASSTPANDNGILVVTDNAALSNLVSTPAGSSYTQSIPLSGSGTTTAPPPPPPAVVPVMDNETIHVTDTESFPDVFDAEAVHLADTVFVTPLIQVSAPVAEFSAGTLGFSGQGGSQTITVSDIGTASLSLASATISGGSQFSITQTTCSNGATSFSTVLPSGGACLLTIGYSASATPANDNGTLVFTDNAALSNLASIPAGSSFTQSVPLSGSGTTTGPPPPPPAVVPVTDNETIHITDTESFPDVFDAEAVHVADTVFVTPLIQVSAPVAEFSAGTLGFSGQGGSQTITLSDIGAASLTVASATISGSSQFAITQVACSNGATSASTTLPSGGACVLAIGYTASATPANDNGMLTFTDNAALSNLVSTPAGSSYTQAIPLSGSGTTTAPPPPPPAVVPVMDNETIHVTDTESFPDIFDSEQITVTDQVSVQVLNTTATSISLNGAAVFGVPVSVTVSVSSPTAAVTGNVSLSVDGGPAVTSLLSSGSATFNLASLSVGPHVLAASFPAQGNFLASSAATKFTVAKATPTISWKNPPPITYGTQLSSAQLIAIASVPGTFVYSPAAGTVLTAGTQTLSVTFTPTDTIDYTTATASVTLQVNQATPTITWANPAPITYGTALSSSQLNATSSVAGTSTSFVYTPAAGTVLTAGTQTLSVVFTPTDTIDYTTATATVTLLVNPAAPTITWANPAPITYGTPISATQLNATASVKGMFTYNVALGTVLGAGSQTLSAKFNPADTTDYTPAAATVTLLVNQATPAIIWANPSAITYGTALSGKQLNATASVAGTLVYNPPAGTVLGAGSQTLSVVFAPNDKVDYTKANANVTLVVNQATPIITWANPAPITQGTPLSSAQLNATASVSGVSLPGTFAYNPPLKTVLGAGTQTLSVTFTPTDTTDYQTVTQSVSITVNVSGSLTVQSGQTYTFNNGSISGNVMVNGGTLTLIGSTVGGTLSVSSGSLTLGGNSTVSNNVQIQGGSFSIGQASIKGNLQIMNVPAGKTPGVVCGASVSGDLQFQYNAIPGQIGPSSCSGNRVGGNLQITNNTAPLQIFKNAVRGNLQVQSNTGSAQVFQNTVQNLLQCSGNSSPFTGGNNTAAGKQGQCISF